MNCKKGFTLVELLIVVLILGALAAIALPRITESAQRARENACATNVDIINTQMEMWAANNNGAYPELEKLTSDADYFPDGMPLCPLDGAYSLDKNKRAVCDHK